MKVTIAQINTTNGDIEGNVAKILAGIEKAKADKSDIVVFPEVVTHGYTSQDWFQDRDIIENALQPLEQIIPATVGITAIVGTIRPNDDKDGRRLYNSAAVISNGELLGFVDKTLLPEYDVFDDPRYFEPNEKPNKLFEIDGKKIGVAGLLVVIIVASIALAPRNISQPKKVSNVNSSSMALMNIELKKLDNIPLVIKVDGRDESDPDSPPRTSFYKAQSNFTFKYGVYSVDKVQLKINGKVINLPRTPPLGDYMIHFEVTKDNLNQVLQNSSNANVSSSSNVNTSASNSASTTEMNIEFTATEPVAFFVNVDGGKEQAIILAPTMVKKFSPQNDFEIKYSPEKAGIIQLKINGKSISLSNKDSGSMTKFKITKDNLNQILQSGKIGQ